MNSTELDEKLESALVRTQHISGLTFLLFNMATVLLIILDDDTRNKNYRKYLCCLQGSSIAFDTISDLYAPIMLTHRGIAFSNSSIAKALGFGKYLAVELVLIGEVALSYFACVYYRRCVVLGAERRFTYWGRQRVAFLTFIQCYIVIVIAVITFFGIKSFQESEQFLPFESYWVREKASYVYMRADENELLASSAVLAGFYVIVLAVVAMISQLLVEVKRGNEWSSSSTLRYQRLAVRSLIIQGAVPSMVYFIPGCCNAFLLFAPALFDDGVNFYQFANVLSPILWIIVGKHSFVGSLTILYCAPSYRKKIVALICFRNASIEPLPLTETLSRSQKAS